MGQRHILLKIFFMLTPHGFPLDNKEGKHCAKNHQRYYNSCDPTASYLPFATIADTNVTAIAST